MPEKFDPLNYAEELDRGFNLHAVGSVTTLAACILCLYNDMFASFIFSKTLESGFRDSEFRNITGTRSEFNTIAYPIYGALIVGVRLFYLSLCCLQRCNDSNASNTDVDTDQENEAFLTKYAAPILLLKNNFAATLEIPEDDIFIHLHNSEERYANAYYFLSCHRHIHFYIGFLKLVEENKASLELTLAHELIHLKRDFPLLINDAVEWIHWATQRLLRIYQLPIQIAYFIAGSVIFGFQPASLYSLGITFMLTLINGFATPHRNRLQESRADFESLFSPIQFSNGEHQKQIEFYGSLSKIENEATGLQRFWIDYLKPNTHPSYQDRIDMVHAALEYRGREPIANTAIQIPSATPTLSSNQ